MASGVYNNYKARMLGLGTVVDGDGDTIKIALLANTYTPDFDSNDFFDDVESHEVGDSGSYAAGGATLSVTISQDDTDDEGVLDAVDVSFTTATISARYAVIYKSTGTSSTSPLMFLIDFGSVKSSSSGTFAITFAAEGLLNIG